jgi:hypothetical protein
MTTTEAPQKIKDYDVLSTIRGVVSEMGRDYVYQKVDGACVYETKDGEPSCIVGHVLARLTPDFKLFDGSVVFHDNRDALRARGYSDKAIAMLQIAQSMQDHEHPWGAALTAATAMFDFYRDLVGE